MEAGECDTWPHARGEGARHVMTSPALVYDGGSRGGSTGVQEYTSEYRREVIQQGGRLGGGGGGGYSRNTPGREYRPIRPQCLF